MPDFPERRQAWRVRWRGDVHAVFFATGRLSDAVRRRRNASDGGRMTEQLPMFPQDLHEAIRDTVRALGGPKRVGHELQPDLDPEAAGRWLSDCCNPDRREKLSPTQLAYIRRRARQAGVHILAEFEARDAGYAPPTPIEPESERAALMREFNRQMEAFVALSRRLESLGAIPPEANDA